MLEELKRIENVQNLRLATWLTEVEYKGFLSDWKNQLQIREELNDKPDELKRYEDKLRKAIFNYSRAEGYSKKGKHRQLRSFSIAAFYVLNFSVFLWILFSIFSNLASYFSN